MLPDGWMDRFPCLLADVSGGWSVPPGWNSALEKLCELLEPFGVRCVQAKEKFGGLRFYVEGNAGASAETVRELVHGCEDACWSICMQCGGMHDVVCKRMIGGWLTTTCASCHAALERERAERLARYTEAAARIVVRE